SVDALLLADFARVGPGWTVVDLGAGVGVVAAVLARRMGRGLVWAVEIQARLAACARINAAALSQAAEIRVLETDWSKLTVKDTGGPVAAVVCNPPYRRLGSGRINPADEEAGARHEVFGSAASATQAAARVLARGGRLALVYPAPRLAGLFRDLAAAGFEPKRLRSVYSRAGEQATLALVEARLGGGEELQVEPALYIHLEDGGYTPETAAILSGGPGGRPGAP
ncbi:MAG: methyltransferase, partial [Thermodesulfobacteriota bacterium]